ncbi:hypothetical protein [Xenophilus azovorans]|uniref:hypothetical protein n=1 Tax=Xenophilus azovorans TaxID=151755 RepID=UPI0012EE2997|nr:hypothetical protein [Xenophilus azovorans]
MSNINEIRECFSKKIKKMNSVLKIKGECPCRLSGPEIKNVEFVAFLPEFGGERGMLLDLITPPDFEPGFEQKKIAEQLQMRVSFLNPESMKAIDEYMLALRDWGYFGHSTLDWMK